MAADLFIELINSSEETITGAFDFKSDSTDSLMDLDIENKKFVSCEILGGDFASGIFSNCTFNQVVFKGTTLVGVNFKNCQFIDCKFSNVECSFYMEDCSIKQFSITKEN